MKQPAKQGEAAEPKKRKEFPPFLESRYFFETKNRRYWYLDPEGKGWKEDTRDDFASFLYNYHGLSKTPKVKGGQSGVQRAIYLVQQNWVNVTTDLAGYHGPRILTHADTRILVKNGPKLVEPFEGDYETLLSFFDGLLTGEPGEHLSCWCADVVRHVYARQLGSFIVPILCGPASAGKSLFQAILTAATGGRSTRPYQVMTGGTPFNEHLFAAEHWIIEDEYSSGDLKARNQLGTAIKNFVANELKLSHGKNKVPFTVPRLLQFLTVTLNNELENISQLPRKHPSLDGKISLYDCQYSPMPMPTGTDEKDRAFWAQLMKELPCWIYDLIYRTPMPAKWQTGRFMVPWRAEKLSAALDELEPYMKMRDLVHILLWDERRKTDEESPVITISRHGDSWLGTPTQIESDLRHQSSPVKTLADDLFRNPSECGRLLTRLCEHFPREYVNKRTAKERLYLLKRPEIGVYDNSKTGSDDVR